MSGKKKDSKGRNLKQGERQRPDGRYEYRFLDAKGDTHSVYSWKLVPTDKVPEGRKNGKSLREMEKEIQRDLDDGIDGFSAGRTTLNDFFEDYIET